MGLSGTLGEKIKQSDDGIHPCHSVWPLGMTHLLTIFVEVGVENVFA